MMTLYCGFLDQKGFVISQITRKNDLTSFFVTDEDVLFRGRLQVDQNTGSLTIRNTRIRHSGQYKLSISREKTTTKIFTFTVLSAVNETDGVKTVSVMEGENVTLNTDTDLHPHDLILWRFGDKGILLAKIDVGTNETSLNEADERFRDRLKTDHQTGSLTITNTRTEHAGLYELQIRGRESSQRFLLSVNDVLDPGLSPGAIAGIAVAVLLVLVVVVIYYRCRISKLKEEVVTNVSKQEGHSLTLRTNVTELNRDDKIQWCYEDENNLIAEIDNEPSTYDGADGRFRNKLTLNPQTGDLTINNIRTLHAGLYRLKIRSKIRTKYNKFIVMVKVEEKSVAKGKGVTLKADVEIQPDDLMLWTYGDEYCLVARADSRTADPELFRDRLELDHQTGSLTIKNIIPTDSGHYNLQITNSNHTICRRFNVTVTGNQGNAEAAL